MLCVHYKELGTGVSPVVNASFTLPKGVFSTSVTLQSRYKTCSSNLTSIDEVKDLRKCRWTKEL